MFRTRPPWVAVTCIGIWLLQLGLNVVLFQQSWSTSLPARGWLMLAVLAFSLALGALLVMQLPRALQWRPRLGFRPSAEVSAERKRIARDLHDKLGSQLVVAMALLDSRPALDHDVLSVLEQCMLDLRLIVDSMDGAGELFADRLARLRHRMQRVLEQRGIEMQWDVQIPEGTTPIRPQVTAQLIAIVQEALSNVLQHSRASQVLVSVRYLPEARSWCLQVSDNGRGLHASQAAGRQTVGAGLPGMQERVGKVGGLLRVAPAAGGGTCVWVVVPGTSAA